MVISKSWSNKIAVVHTSKLVVSYKGMVDVQQILNDQRKIWQSELDTLEADYRLTVNRLNQEWKGLSGAEKQDRQELVELQQQNLQRHTFTTEQRAKEEQEKLLMGVLSQVNDVIKLYALEHGYDIVYGATPDGSILYAEDDLDITDEILQMLNTSYSDSSRSISHAK